MPREVPPECRARRKEMGTLEGSITPTGAGKERWQGGWLFDHSITPSGAGKERRSLILVVRESPPRARGRRAQGKFPEAGGSRQATRQPGSPG